MNSATTTTLEDYFEFLSPDDIQLKGHRIGIDNVGNVLDVRICGHTARPNSWRLMNNPITVSCIFSVLEQQIVFLASRLIRILKVKCLRSIR